MKELSELDFPETVRYTEDHEWAAVDGDTVRIGVSDYAQDQLGDIVYVEMPEVGDMFEKEMSLGPLNRSRPCPNSTCRWLVRWWPSTMPCWKPRN